MVSRYRTLSLWPAAACLGLLVPLPAHATDPAPTGTAAPPGAAASPSGPGQGSPDAEVPAPAPDAAPATPAPAPVPVPAPAAPDAAQPSAARPPTAQPPTAEAAPPVARENLDLASAIRTMGQDVKGPSGTVVGQLVNILVDNQGQPRAAVLDYGGFLGVGKRRIAVTWRALRFGAEGIQLGLSREQLRGVPDFKDAEAPVLAAPPAAVPDTPGDTPPAQ